MSRSNKVMLVVTVLQGVNSALYLCHTAMAPSGGRFAMLAFTLAAFFYCLYALVYGMKVDRKLKDNGQ